MSYVNSFTYSIHEKGHNIDMKCMTKMFSTGFSLNQWKM